ncbi:MAG: oligosaccharide flippase family protein [Cyanothece sp. SIO1E1]|nr:oligosaccharide flippase family protein [Cyanothece sp. SIO1E1]
MTNQQTTNVGSIPSRSLKKRALNGSLWTMGGYGLNQILRFGSNLILTRLLFPETFGLMTLVNVFMQGLQMFSDIGIIPSIIQNKRGNDSAFLNTAWTIQVGRGFLLWLLSCLLAFPAAEFYNEPMLRQLLPVVGINALIAGFNSTKLATSNRKLMLGRLTLIELSSYVLGVIVMILWALRSPSIWALAAGGLVSALAKMVCSHLFLVGPRNYFHWESEAFRALQSFGQWIFVSTALTFFAGQGDRLILGHFLGLRLLGVFGIAALLARFFSELLNRLGNRVLFPSYAELFREQPEKLYLSLRKGRILMIIASWAVSLCLIFLGKQLIDLLYDDRYTEAGWILQTIALAMLVNVLHLTYNGVFEATGKTSFNAIVLVFQVTIKIAMMFLGFLWWDEEGVIFAVAFSGWISFPARAFFLQRLSLWQWEIDLPVIVLAFIVAAIYYLSPIWGLS